MLFLDAQSRSVAFWLALEEYVHTQVSSPAVSSAGDCDTAERRIGADGVVFVWQPTVPTIVFGRNQVPEAEFDIERARREGVTLVRRPSGGGAIYADGGTLFYSLLLPFEAGASPSDTLRQGAEPLVRALRRLGVAAKLCGRNDLELAGSKISGFAQYVHNGVFCAHCTLLYDTDLTALGSLLRPDREKYQSKALKSVRSRVTNIASHLPDAPDTLDFRARLQEALLQELPHAQKQELGAEDVAAVEALRVKRFEDPAWLWGKTPPFSYRNKQRFAGGSLEVLLDVKQGVIANCSLRGDFLGLLPVEELEQHLVDVRYERKELASALKPINLPQYLGTITTTELLTVLFR